MTHPGYEASDEEIAEFWRSTNAPASLIEEAIKRDLEFKHRPRLEWDGVRFCEGCHSLHPHFKEIKEKLDEARDEE